MKLAVALLRRKELSEKLARIGPIKQEQLFTLHVKRISVTDAVDEVTAHAPKCTLADVTAEYDFYSKQLRLIDAMIQQANWTTEIEGSDNLCEDYVAPAA